MKDKYKHHSTDGNKISAKFQCKYTRKYNFIIVMCSLALETVEREPQKPNYIGFDVSGHVNSIKDFGTKVKH